MALLQKLASLVAILFGVVTVLAGGRVLLGVAPRAVFWKTYRADEDERARAAGWAVNFATAMADGGGTRHVRIGRAVMERLSN